MTIKTAVGNGAVAIAGYVGGKMAVLATAAPTVAPHSLNEVHHIVGFAVPNWVGVALYFVFLVLGAIFGSNQETPVDDKFKRPYMKPIYSLVFGVGVTLFVLPELYPSITIWGLLLPALFFAAIGAVVIYFVIAFFTSPKLWGLITDWGHESVAEYLKGFPARVKAAVDAFLKGGK